MIYNDLYIMMHGLLGSDNICPKYNFWEPGIWGCQKNLNIENIAFKIVWMKF